MSMYCIQCGHKHEDRTGKCSMCGYEPAQIEGFQAYIPEAARANEGLSPKAHSLCYEHELGHFWFEHRSSLVKYFIESNGVVDGKWAEIGCGTGFMLGMVGDNFPGFEVTGIDIYSHALSFAKTRCQRANLMQGSIEAIPFSEEFDAIGCFDVLEHVDDDRAAIRELHRILKKTGLAFITVPQHKFLWSKVDEMDCHKRRYEKKDLIEKLEDAGFTIRYATSFISLLLPAMGLSRLKENLVSGKKTFEDDYTSELNIPPFLNKIFAKVCQLELFAIKRGLQFPCGGSLFILAEKKTNA